MSRLAPPLVLAASTLLVLTTLPAQQAGPKQPEKRRIELADVMRFKSIRSAKISADGKLIACEIRPDRGDPEVRVYYGPGSWHRMKRGVRPVIAKDSKHVLCTRVAPFLAEGKDKPRNALWLLSLETGVAQEIPEVEEARFSPDGRYVAWLHFAPKQKPEKSKTARKDPGRKLVLRDLQSGADSVVEAVSRFGFSEDSRTLTYVLRPADAKADAGIAHRDLAAGSVQREVLPGRIERFAWSEQGSFAFSHAPEDAQGKPQAAALHIREMRARGGRRVDFAADAFGKGYVLDHRDPLSWSKDGAQLRFGLRSAAGQELLASVEAAKSKQHKAAAKKALADDPFDIELLRAGREMDVWHHRDPLINSNQKKVWARESKRTYACIVERSTWTLRRLAGPRLPDLRFVEGSPYAIGSSDLHHRRLRTWDGRYRDLVLVDTRDGKRTRLLSRFSGRSYLAPQTADFAYYQRGHWFLREGESGKRRLLTQRLGVGFADEDHDYPSANRGHGAAGWATDGSGLLVYDRYDLWFLPREGKARCLSQGEGRKRRIQLRVVDLDPDSPHVDLARPLWLHGMDEKTKGSSIWLLHPGDKGLELRAETEDRIKVLAKAEDADRVLYTQEDYDRYPDVAVSDLRFGQRETWSGLDRQREAFHWGSAELISWRSQDGRPLQGAVIKPPGYDPKKRYPVLVYYYRFFSQRVNEWNAMAVNHRPNFPWWTGQGYVVFLPDIRFDIGRPGPAATKCLVPGMQKLIDLGIAHPDKIALHGHSWSGYQTAFVITQTSMFACAIAGAPVSNMTSAYGGVRWGTGLSRQFQYEKTQSRIGGSLWEFPERYIENSPLFFADRIETPLLIQFGDEDEAVPWYQGIELYMAMRRLDKPCVFLQYRGEPHHLKQYANKVDYTLRFKEYVDHYCKGTRMPAWVRRGEPYQGR